MYFINHDDDDEYLYINNEELSRQICSHGANYSAEYMKEILQLGAHHKFPDLKVPVESRSEMPLTLLRHLTICHDLAIMINDKTLEKWLVTLFNSELLVALLVCNVSSE